MHLISLFWRLLPVNRFIDESSIVFTHFVLLRSVFLFQIEENFARQCNFFTACVPSTFYLSCVNYRSFILLETRFAFLSLSFFSFPRFLILSALVNKKRKGIKRNAPLFHIIMKVIGYKKYYYSVKIKRLKENQYNLIDYTRSKRDK